MTEPLVLNGVTMGTTYTVKVADAPLPAPRDQLPDLVFDALDEVDRRMSTFIEESELSQLNRNSSMDWVPVSRELFSVLERAMQASRLSGGAFDVTVGPLVNLWGFGPAENSRRIPANAEIAAVLARTGYTRLVLDEQRLAVRKARPDLYIDLSGIAKGYGADVVADSLSARGVKNFMVEVGGEIRAAGRNERGQVWRLGIETPGAGRRSVKRVIDLRDSGMATSGDYRNYFERDGVRYSHIIDPADGRPIRHRLASVTVVHPSATCADALATALLVLGPEKGVALAEREKLAALFIIRTDDGFEQKMSPEFALLAGAGRAR
ncbi:MAG: FAD:protein FMN transferase [Gammaproteobacteria bacterium]|nr:FAD:protein FMN transferase [Gammaproteobacteria bacterium]